MDVILVLLSRHQRRIDTGGDEWHQHPFGTCLLLIFEVDLRPGVNPAATISACRRLTATTTRCHHTCLVRRPPPNGTST
jgi:hypothetical protein